MNHRLEKLEGLLQKTIHSAFTKMEILERLNNWLQENDYDQISERTFDNDLRALREKGAEIITERLSGHFYNHEGRETRAKTVLYYMDPSFSVFDDQLSQIEIEQIRTAVAIIERMAGNTVLAEIPLILKQKLRIQDNMEVPVHIDQNMQYSGRKFIQPCLDAVINQQTLLVTYRSFQSEEEQQFDFFPYLLKQYNNRWYCIGRKAEEEFIANLAMDRIVSMKGSTSTFESSGLDIADWVDRFDEIIGVTYKPEVPLEKIRLKFYGDARKYVLTKPMHISQEVLSDDVNADPLEIALEIRANYELRQQILFYGDQVEVVEPVQLRMDVLDTLQRGISRYL